MVHTCMRAMFVHSLPPKISTNNNEKLRSFKSKENIHKKEVGPYRENSFDDLFSSPEPKAHKVSL